MTMTETHSKGKSSEETRNLYRQKYEAQIREWNAKVDEIKAHTAKLGAEARLEMQPRVDTVHRKYAAARSKLHELASAADDTWEDLKRNAEQAWTDFKSSIEGAYDALKSHDKPPQQKN
jgi:histidinol dehydrogenase